MWVVIHDRLVPNSIFGPLVERIEPIEIPCTGVNFWQEIFRSLNLPNQQGRRFRFFPLPFLRLVNLLSDLHVVVSQISPSILGLGNSSLDAPRLVDRLIVVVGEQDVLFRSQDVDISCLLFGQQCAIVHQGLEFELTLHFLRLRSLRLRQAFLHLCHVHVRLELFDIAAPVQWSHLELYL